MTKKKDNYLDYIPRHNKLFPYAQNEKGHVEVQVENRGFANRIAQKFFKKPKVSYIELDDYGTFVWNQMDGVKTIYEIGQCVEQHFGDQAKPVLERLCLFTKTLHEQHYIVYVNKLNKRKEG